MLGSTGSKGDDAQGHYLWLVVSTGWQGDVQEKKIVHRDYIPIRMQVRPLRLSPFRMTSHLPVYSARQSVLFQGRSSLYRMPAEKAQVIKSDEGGRDLPLPPVPA